MCKGSACGHRLRCNMDTTPVASTQGVLQVMQLLSDLQTKIGRAP